LAQLQPTNVAKMKNNTIDLYLTMIYTSICLFYD